MSTGIAGRLGKPLRLALRTAGIGLYHLGLSQKIVNLSPHRIRTLLYHSVEDHPSNHIAGLNVNVTPATFAVQMEFVRKHYSVSTIETALDRLGGLCPALITFDDGYYSVERNAVPILEKNGLPATVFLIGNAVTRGKVWVNQLNHALNCHDATVRSVLWEFPTLIGLSQSDLIFCVQTTFTPAKIEALLARITEATGSDNTSDSSSEPLFSSAEGIRAMQKRDIHFGFHTNNHYNLQLCDDVTLSEELNSSSVRGQLNSNTFAYPFGYYTDSSIRMLTQQGYAQLMTVGSGTRSCSALHTGRSEVFGTTAAAVFAQLEIEEPAMKVLRRVAHQLIKLFKGPSPESVELAKSTAIARAQSSLPLKRDLPETSKPR